MKGTATRKHWCTDHIRRTYLHVVGGGLAAILLHDLRKVGYLLCVQHYHMATPELGGAGDIQIIEVLHASINPYWLVQLGVSLDELGTQMLDYWLLFL